jgi:hypothetical protein
MCLRIQFCIHQRVRTLHFLQKDQNRCILQCCGSGMFIPDPGSDFFHPGSELSPSRILIKEFKYFNPKKSKKNGFQALKNMIRVVHPGSGC